MRRFILCVLLIALIISIPVCAHAATQATNVSTYATVSSDESCDVTMTVTIHLDSPVSKLTFPIPAKASAVSLNGSRVGTSRSGGVRYVDLTHITGGMPGDFTVAIGFHLNDVVAYNDTGFLVLQVPLLSGFEYPVAKFDCSVMLPGEVVTKPSFSSGYHHTNIEQDLTFSVAGATVTCNSVKELKDKETLSMSVNVTDGMFPQSVIRLLNLGPLYVIMGLCAGIALAYWIVFLRNFPPRFPAYTTPPEGYTAGEMRSIISLRGADLSLMVFTWAQLGYILIHMDKRERVLLYMRMEMGNERSAFEQKCFRLLFTNRTVVDATSMRYAMLCQKVEKLSPSIQNLAHPKNSSFMPFRVFMALTGAFDGICMGLTLGSEAAAPWLLGITLGLVFLFGSWYIQEWAECLVSYRSDKLYIALGITALWLILSLFAGTAALDVWVFLGQFLAGLLLIFGGRRTHEGRQLTAEALGLSRYLLTLPSIQASYISHQNPDYFYDMAPYAIALGVDKFFASHFGNTILTPCPYVQAPVKDRLNAAQWNEVLHRILQLMQAQQRRQALGNLLSLIRGFTR